MSFHLSRRMKSDLAGLVVLGLVSGLVGCGGSSDSRQRNAVAGETAIPCTLGGRGPTGGIVVSLATGTSGTSVESARANWTTESQVNWNTITQKVNEYRGGGFSDWKLPTIEQMDTLGNPILQYVGANMIWSSTAVSGSTYAWYWRGYRSVADQTTGPSAAGWVMQAVPVRNFTEASTPCMAAAVATTTTTTIAATTTTTGVPATCANGGVCAKQEIGGGGGTIVSESTNSAGGATYLEVAPATWTENDLSLQMVDNYSISVAQKVTTYTIGGKNDWHLPTINEFATWCTSGLGMIDKSAIYWVQNDGGATLAGTASSCSSSYGQTNSRTMLHVRPVRTTGVSAQVRAAAIAYYAANPTTTVAAPTTTSTTTTTTTIAPTTTRAASKCATGGSCAVGDTGPGGGVVFYVSSSEIDSASGISDGGKYLEAAPNTWNGGNSDPALPWCDKTTTMIGNATALGQGASNTKKLAAACNSTSAANIVANLYFNKWDDWFLPSGWELSYMWQNREKIGGFNNSTAYWSSSEVPGNVANGAQRLIFNPVRWMEDTKAGNSLVRPIRAFNEGAIPPKAPTTTLAATTTTSTVPLAPECRNIISCKVGERGPGDSVIISAVFEGPTSRYLAVARDGWNGTAIDPKMTLAEAQAAVNAYKPGGTSDWTLPSYVNKWGGLDQMEALCRYAHNYMPTTSNSCDSSKPLRANWSATGDNEMKYWTSHPTAPSGASGYGTIMRVRDGSYWADSRSARNYVRPVLEFSYTAPPIPTTTTTIPQKCAQGGICKIGDVSPTGGLIVQFFGSGSNITYTEIAPRNWDAGLAGLDNGNGDDPLAKKAVAATMASQFRGGGKTDWHLPNLGEMRDAFTVTEVPTFSASTERNGQRACKVTSAAGIANWSRWGFYTNYWITGATPVFSYPTGGVYQVVDNLTDVDARDWQYYVRPVRRGTYNGPAMSYQNPTYSPAECETVPMATTTTAPSTRTCAQGGWCKVGDEGQRGGIVISVDNSKPRGQRNVEIAKFGWKFGRDDCAGTSIISSCTPGEWSPSSASSIGDGYRLPTVAELLAVGKLPAATRNKLKLIDHYYWTSDSSGKNMNVSVPLDSGAEDRRLNSASYELVDAHWAVKISTGFTVSETFAYTRPVRAF